MIGNDNPTIHCSFCGKNQSEVFKIISGQGVYICNDCVDLCIDILQEDPGEDLKTPDGKKLLPPMEIKKFLDSYIVGQERAKKSLAVAVYNHYKRCNFNKSNRSIELQKSNILLIGPTGTGKTLLAQTLAKVLDVPFAIADATTLTEAGYVGEDVENVVLKLLQNADHDIERAEKGIIYIDEIDKIVRKSEGVSITRDVSGEGVQQALLKIIEGMTTNLPPQGGRKHPEQDYTQIDTSNILFICGGAFVGLEDLIHRRIGQKSIGFGEIHQNKKETTDILAQVEPEDFSKYGLIPEFIGRLPIVAILEELDENDLVQILQEPKNAIIKQYQKLLEMDGIKLSFSEGSVRAIAQEAIKRKTGARGLRSILESIMLDVMYEAPSNSKVKECRISSSVILKGTRPRLIQRKPTKKIKFG